MNFPKNVLPIIPAFRNILQTSKQNVIFELLRKISILPRGIHRFPYEIPNKKTMVSTLFVVE